MSGNTPHIDREAQLLALAALSADARVTTLRAALPDAELYLVGGCVRDSLLGRPVTDLDLATNLTPEQLRQALESPSVTAVFRVIPTGLKHQTVTVLIGECPHPVEITTFRSAGISATQPTSFSSSITEDLEFRDFTINAMALGINARAVIDPHGGCEDLAAGRIRAVGHAHQRFVEDPLRMMRFVRFAVQLGFSEDRQTADALRESAALLGGVAIERIRDEFSKIILSDAPERGLLLLHQLGLLDLFLPEVSAMVGFEQNRFHHLDLFSHSLEVLKTTEARLSLRLAALLHDIGKVPTLTTDESGERHFYRHEHVGAEMVERTLERLRYPLQIQREVTALVRTHMRPIQAGDAGIRRLIRDTQGVFEDWRALKEADALACLFDKQTLKAELSHFDERVAWIRSQPDVSPLSNLALRGGDILALNVPAGPRVGEILRALHELVLEDPTLNTRDALLREAKKMAATE
jgi:tRNA nucleotidyltransferase (CCA-adding enzyme)